METEERKREKWPGSVLRSSIADDSHSRILHFRDLSQGACLAYLEQQLIVDSSKKTTSSSNDGENGIPSVSELLCLQSWPSPSVVIEDYSKPLLPSELVLLKYIQSDLCSSFIPTPPDLSLARWKGASRIRTAKPLRSHLLRHRHPNCPAKDDQYHFHPIQNRSLKGLGCCCCYCWWLIWDGIEWLRIGPNLRLEREERRSDKKSGWVSVK